MKIVLSGIFYPMAILRYFEAALKRRDDVELFTVGPCTGAWIPWANGMHLPAKYAVQPDFALPKIQNYVPIGYVENQLPWTPDLWLQIDAGFYLHGKPDAGKNVIVGTDPHVLEYGQQRTFADQFYCMQTPYMAAGDRYLPYAYDPKWHKPEEQEENYDVCLIGLHYADRNQLVDRLRGHGLKVYYDLGPSFDEARALYNQAPIGLNWSSLQDLTARVFELLGMKRLAVVNKVPDLDTFFQDGQDLIAFDNIDEAVSQVIWYKENREEAQKIAEQGHETVKEHTWDNRIRTILSEL